MPERVIQAVAHRGDPYEVRENTIPSLRSAIAAGADAVEIDVRLTADGVPVLLHDATLERLWGEDVPLADLTCAEAQKRSRGGIPTLREALETTAESGGARPFIDLPDPAAVEATVAAVHEAGQASHVYYCGPTTSMLRVRAADSAAEIALTCGSAVPHPPGLITRLRPRWLNYRFGLLDEATVRRAHEEGRLVSAWTVDWRRNWRRLRAMGVDSITTNRVGALRRFLAD
jgi:glycerophosphoryl diester phosphodiesterase